jgi:hypothetical protein
MTHRASCACYHGHPCTRSTRCAVEAVELERDQALTERTELIAALRDLVDYTDPAKDVSLASASARVERARALLERLGGVM